ncbi:MAG: diacylglycerol kinase family lipid kinase [Lachnospiraceae bacterium]|jgi:YegS/Rv2252/BmrU family lipid kinase|nr:diacylglycerol kinase family lipid kinase [Lachnospiraceae bacterium]
MLNFIVNPNARSGLGSKIWAKLEEVLKARETEYQVFFTKYQRHATLIARDITADGLEHTIVVLGGDGSVNETVNGIKDLTKVTFGYIPIGSSNDFARGLSLTRDPIPALLHIISPEEYKEINIGVLSYGEKKRRFVNSAGAGFDAGVCHQVVISKLKAVLNKLKLGKLVYAGVAFDRIVTLDPKDMSITLDGTKKMDFKKVVFAAAMNNRYEGGGFLFCPKAGPSDDILDIIVVADMPKSKILALLPLAFKGWHVFFKGVHIFQCKEAEFDSTVALPLHTDGEPIFLQHKLKATLESTKLKVIIS